ncbi:MAG: GatB/YqeY domain-containing protein [Thermomicrobiales bacterium]
MADDCLFCKIIAGDIPATIAGENEAAIAFHDINPQAPVHVLIVPRAHITGLREIDTLPAMTVHKMLTLATGLAESLGLNESGYRLLTNDGPMPAKRSITCIGICSADGPWRPASLDRRTRHSNKEFKMGLKEQLQDDLKKAMVARDEVRRDTIRFVLSNLKNAEIDERGPLTPEQDLALLNRVSKRLVEAIDQYDAAGRDDLAEKERAQLAIVKDYLPAELSDEDLAALVAEVVAEVGAETPKDMGKVMPVLLPRVAGRADGKRVSTAVKAALQG